MSHHSMTSFFSGTDTQELKDNCKNFNYYLSLIVNFDNKYCAKVGFYSSSEVKTKFSIKDSLGRLFNKQIVKTEESVLIGDLDIEIQGNLSSPQWLTERYEALKNKNKVTAVKSFTTNGSYYQAKLYEEEPFYYKTSNWNKKDDNRVQQFVVSLLNLDVDKKEYGLSYSLEQACKLEDEDITAFLNAIDLNIESIYCQIYPEDVMMKNFEKVCKEADDLLEAQEKYCKKEITVLIGDLLFNRYIGETVE